MIPTGRTRALGGIAGPVAFVATWAYLGAREPSYSFVEDPISRLAAVGAENRVPMTLGFLAFSLGVGLAAGEVRTAIGRGAGAAAAATAFATAGLAVTPLDSRAGGLPHAACAAAAYAALAALPILGRGHWRRRGRRPALTSAAVGVVTGGLLVASVVADGRDGLYQRAGVVLGDAWIVVTSLSLLRGDRAAAGGGR